MIASVLTTAHWHEPDSQAVACIRTIGLRSLGTSGRRTELLTSSKGKRARRSLTTSGVRDPKGLFSSRQFPQDDGLAGRVPREQVPYTEGSDGRAWKDMQADQSSSSQAKLRRLILVPYMGSALTGASGLGSDAVCSRSVQTMPSMVKISGPVVPPCSSMTLALSGLSRCGTSHHPTVT